MLVRTDVQGVAFIVLLLAVLLRWCVSLHPYSGEGHPPMFGDYEAQRHWMEITRNLPLQDWYYNTTENDLMYWGLDYPPLTAYHSFLCGHLAYLVNPDFVSLGSSHGYESYGHKLFMRFSVLIADLLIFIPAVWWYFYSRLLANQNSSKSSSDGDASLQLLGKHENESALNTIAMYLTLIYPGLILIDYGHFQYNGISLGLTVAAIASIMQGSDIIASVLFCLSLNYKQMELYHSLPFFCYLLGKCLPKHNSSFMAGFLKLIKLSSVVIVTFFIIWFPFLKNLNLVMQVLHRIFPLARGVFEDKVSNVWCSINVLFKFRNFFSNFQMTNICLLVTFLTILPSTLDMLLRPRLNKFLVSLINSSLAFFLFSFQVHEKSILLAAIPVSLYLPVDPLPCFWFLFISTFSMLPLLLKDGLLLAYISLTVFYSVSVFLTVNLGFIPLGKKTDLPKSRRPLKKTVESQVQPSLLLNNLLILSFTLSLTICVILTGCSVALTPPVRYPDLFPLLISIFSCAHFVAFFAYFNYRQIFILNASSKLKSN